MGWSRGGSGLEYLGDVGRVRVSGVARILWGAGKSTCEKGIKLLRGEGVGVKKYPGDGVGVPWERGLEYPGRGGLEYPTPQSADGPIWSQISQSAAAACRGPSHRN